ncbi:MAG: hypothetical protein H6742_07585 [Alphaproteobacteria bacterium]|nr:hypothetical protein [Alphaproteobacteria bacterium]
MTPFSLGLAVPALLTGCFLLGDGGQEAATAAEQKLKAGDLPGADADYSAAAAEHADNVDVATGAAFMALQRGNAGAADRFLADAEAGAGDRIGEVKLRRALVALDAGDLESVKTHGVASGMPAGQLLAAEVALADGEREEAQGLLEQARAGGGDIAGVADQYLDLLSDDEPIVAGLSEAQALWALGERKIAVRSVEELIVNLPESFDGREEQTLLWAGRAASVRETQVARGLLDSLIFAPEGQQWRKVATMGLIACADGDSTTCVRTLSGLEGNAPADGVADARATGAWLIAETDPDAARKLAGPYISNAAARALLETGDRGAAQESSPGGALGQFLEAGG